MNAALRLRSPQPKLWTNDDVHTVESSAPRRMPRRGAAAEAVLRAGQAVLGSASSSSSSSTPMASASLARRSGGLDFEPRTSFLLPSQTPSWFPGHMQRAIRSLPALLSRTTPVLPLVIEVRDARLPLTSINPAFERMLRQVYGASILPDSTSLPATDGDIKGKAVEGRQPTASGWQARRLVVYTKRDLISNRIEGPLTDAFSEHGQRVMFVDTRSDRDVKRIHKWAMEQARLLFSTTARQQIANESMSSVRLVGAARHTSTPEVGVRIIIMGMPNVGKSTLINALRRVGVGRGSAVQTAPHPGHTRKVAGTVRITEQSSKTPTSPTSFSDEPPIYVYDTPGIMVPFLGRGTRGAERGLKLALAAGIRTDLFDPQMLADYLLYRMNLRHAYALSHRSESNGTEPTPSYLQALPISRYLPGPTNDINELLAALAPRVPGALSKGGAADLDSAATFMIQRWRDGKFGVDEGDLDLGLNELEGRIVAVDDEQTAVLNGSEDGLFSQDEETRTQRIRRLVTQHMNEVEQLDEVSRPSSRAPLVDAQDTDEVDEANAEPSPDRQRKKAMPVLLSNHQARKQAKRSHLDAQRVKYAAQGLLRPSGAGQKRAGRRGIHTASVQRAGSMLPGISQQSPITADEFAERMQCLERRASDLARGFALSVSGGVDSMALAFMAARWRDSFAPSAKVAAAIVDHGLRAESADEASLTRKRVEELGIDAEVITIPWGHNKYPARPQPDTSFEASARAARRLALLHFLRTHRLHTILFGHHADDQVETAVLRAMRGSCDVVYGADGLGGMRVVDDFGAHALLAGLARAGGVDFLPMSPFDETLTVSRPLLPFPKARLRATCEEAGVSWAEDPTNDAVVKNARNLIRKLVRDMGHGRTGSPVGRDEHGAYDALQWCLRQAHDCDASSGSDGTAADTLRRWVRSVSDRRDRIESTVAQLFKKIVISSSRGDGSLQIPLADLPPHLDPTLLKLLLRSICNSIAAPLQLSSGPRSQLGNRLALVARCPRAALAPQRCGKGAGATQPSAEVQAGPSRGEWRGPAYGGAAGTRHVWAGSEGWRRHRGLPQSPSRDGGAARSTLLSRWDRGTVS